MKGKGKSKGKGKGKFSNHMLGSNAMWKGKGKSKSPPARPAVSAYMTESLFGLELPAETFEVQSQLMPPTCSPI